jgi:hypothetical protein
VALGAAPTWPQAATAPDFGGERAADDVRQLARDVLTSHDNGGRAFAIVDKKQARMYLFDRAGHLRGASPVLLGEARGDASAADVGQHAQTGNVPPHERTTPAGRFISEPGRNLHGESIVWVDYEAAFAIHRLRPGTSEGPRAARLASINPEDRRVSWGCVVVPVDFYLNAVARLLGRRRGVVYVMPESGGAPELLPQDRKTAPVRAASSLVLR